MSVIRSHGVPPLWRWHLMWGVLWAAFLCGISFLGTTGAPFGTLLLGGAAFGIVWAEKSGPLWFVPSALSVALVMFLRAALGA